MKPHADAADDVREAPVSERLRRLAGWLGQGVVMATSRGPGNSDVGRIISGVGIVSLEPPLVMWSFRGDLASVAGLAAKHPVMLHLLAQDQAHLLGKFGQTRLHPLGDVPRDHDARGVPVIKGCAALLACRVAAHLGGEGHTVLMAEVQSIEITGLPPLGFVSAEPAPIPGGPLPEWLGPGTLSHLLARAFHQLRLGYLPVLARHNLSEAQYFLMTAAALNPGESLGRLTRMLAVSGYKVGSTDLQPLVQRGLVLLGAGKDPAVSLTDAGRTTVVDVGAAARLNEARATADFDGSRVQWLKEQLAALIERTRSEWQAPR